MQPCHESQVPVDNMGIQLLNFYVGDCVVRTHCELALAGVLVHHLCPWLITARLRSQQILSDAGHIALTRS